MWCRKVEFELDRFIFVAPKPIPEEEWTKLCKQYGEHQTGVLPGDALLIDLRGKEPIFVSVPPDYKPPEVVDLLKVCTQVVGEKYGTRGDVKLDSFANIVILHDNEPSGSYRATEGDATDS